MSKQFSEMQEDINNFLKEYKERIFVLSKKKNKILDQEIKELENKKIDKIEQYLTNYGK